MSDRNASSKGASRSETNLFTEDGYGPGRRDFLRSALYSGLIGGALSSNVRDALAGVAADSEKKLNYYPAGLYVWDSWYFTDRDEVHVIHLQKRRPVSNRPEQEDGALGHAVSTDLLTWKELPPALYRGQDGSVDDMPLFTGWTTPHKGKYYLFYTARSKSESGLLQRICLATSKDTIRWAKHHEPVIVPDPRWYAPSDCRDLVVRQHPETGEFHGFYAAARPRKELVERPVIAHVRTRDLIHWTHEPPAFVPSSRFGVVEVPDVFYLDGRWWMICATGNFDGVRGGYNDPYIVMGTIYAGSDRLEGPYCEGHENVLMGSMEFNGFSCRTVEWRGKLYVLHSQAERRGRLDRGPATIGSLSTPKELRVSTDGRLRLTYSPLLENRALSDLTSGHMPRLEEPGGLRFGTPGDWRVSGKEVRGISPVSWSVRLWGAETDSFILSCRLKLMKGRSIGLLFRQWLAVILDYQEQCVMFTHLPWMFRLDARRVQLECGREYTLRVVAKGEYFEVYMDNDLILNFVRYEPARGRFGIFIEGGEGMFSDLRAVGLRV